MTATKVLTREALEELGLGVEQIDTSGFTEIDEETAKELVGLRLKSGSVDYEGDLGPSRAHVPAVREASDYRRLLDLDGLEVLSDSAAEHLGKFDGAIFLNRLANLTDVALGNLCQNASELSLNGLTCLSESAAVELQRFQGFNLFLDGLTSLPRNVASTLFDLHTRGDSLELSLNGLRNLDVESAFELRNFKGSSLSLDGLTDLSSVAAESISQIAPTRGRLDISLNGLTSLTDEAADYLSKVNGDLSLNGLESLSYAVAESMSNFQGLNLWLDGLRNLSPEAAASLSRAKPPLNRFFGCNVSHCQPVC